MSIYRDAFRRARQEGRRDFRQLPWEESEKPVESPVKKQTEEVRIPGILQALSINVFTDF